MKFLYDFGISQDDPNVEGHALRLKESNLLCIASGGEIPLSLLAKYDTHIKALDISINQIRLCRLKLISVLELDPREAAILLGFRKDPYTKRRTYFAKVSSSLSSDDIDFWNRHNITKGPIRCSRFESYISHFCSLIGSLMGKKRLRQYFNLESVEEQEIYFDKYLHNKIIHLIFKVAFSPSLYKKRGLDKKALIHQRGNDMAVMFYNKFKKFFTSTLARYNYHLQFYFLNEIIYEQAYPAYLQQDGVMNVRKRYGNLKLEVKSLIDEVSESESLSYGNYALSNISDWCEERSMNDILVSIKNKSVVPANILMRYIHKNPMNDYMKDYRFVQDANYQEMSKNLDRFPFYSLIRTTVNYPNKR